MNHLSDSVDRSLPGGYYEIVETQTERQNMKTEAFENLVLVATGLMIVGMMIGGMV